MRALANLCAGVVFLPVAAVVALAERFQGKPERPAVLFGITPIINIKYWSRALARRGYRTATFVYHVYRINSAGDFDFLPEKLFPRLARVRPFVRWLCFLWGLRRFNVFVLDIDGGFLAATPFRYLELPLYALARKRVVAIPYGGDALDVRRLDDATAAALRRDAPILWTRAAETRRRVRHYTRWASFFVVGGMMLEHLERADMILTSPLAVDTDEWRPGSTARDPGPVRVLHAPNHRHVKGTEHLVRACEELMAEGVPVELVLAEGRPNEEIRRLMERADIVAAAFVMGIYALFEIEGMSMGKPVVTRWRPDLKRFCTAFSYAGACPIVDAGPHDLKEKIRMLVEDPGLRATLGERGRRYVERYHSYEAAGAMLETIIGRIWPP